MWYNAISKIKESTYEIENNKVINEKHPDTNRPQDCYEEDDGMFRFENVVK